MKVDEFMREHYPEYNTSKWEHTVDTFINSAGRYPLLQLPYVPITGKELETIRALGTIRLERLAYTILVIAKFGNARNPENNNWVNCEMKDIFKLARVPCTVAQQCLFINDLMNHGLIKYSKRIDNININVLFVDEDGPAEIKIDDMRELGYSYMRWKGENFSRCADCGILFRQSAQNNRKYCNKCSVYQKRPPRKIVCQDCGVTFSVPSSNKRTTRCETCMKKHVREANREKVRKFRAKSACG